MNEPLPPRALQYFGLALIVAALAYTLVTGRATFDFLGTGTTLVTLGSVIQVQQRRAREREYELPPGPPPDSGSSGPVPEDPVRSPGIVQGEGGGEGGPRR